MSSNRTCNEIVHIFNILRWDGSCLGQWSEVEMIRSSNRYDSSSVIKFNGITLEVQIYQSSIPYMCLVDEMKGLFELNKRGTHWFKRGMRSVVITRAYSNTFTLKEFMDRSNYRVVDLRKYQPRLYEQIRKIYILRNLFGVKNSNLSSIKIIDDSINRDYQALSIGEVNSIKTGQIAELPCNIIDDFFDDVDPERVAYTIYRRSINSKIKKSKGGDISSYIGIFNDIIDDVAHRIDKRLLPYTSDIKARFLNTITSYRQYNYSTISAPSIRK